MAPKKNNSKRSKSRAKKLSAKKRGGKKHQPKTAHLKPFQWKPGQSGNLSGRPKSKPIREAIERVLEEEPKLLRKIALNAAKQAAKNLGYFREVRDMFDGKPVQAISGPDGDPIPLTVEGIDQALLKLFEAAEQRKAESK